MSPRVFLCFEYQGDFWRVQRLLDAEVFAPLEVSGVFGPLDWNTARQAGDVAVRRLILDALEQTQVTLLLIGTNTATDTWVTFALKQSIARGNGLLGLHIHMLKDEFRIDAPRGRKPALPEGAVLPTYDWDGDVVRLQREIAAAHARSAHFLAAPRG